MVAGEEESGNGVAGVNSVAKGKEPRVTTVEGALEAQRVDGWQPCGRQTLEWVAGG